MKKHKSKKHRHSRRSSKHGPKAISKGAFYQAIADSVKFDKPQTALKKKQVASMFETISGIVEKSLKHNPKNITIPGLVRIKVAHKKATKKRKGTNPFTGKPTIFKAKPARDVVKVRPIKALKELI